MDNDKVFKELQLSTIDFPWFVPLKYNLSELCQGTKEEFFKKNKIIYDTSKNIDFLCIVKSGRVGHYIITGDGHQKLVGVFTEGTLFGETQAFDKRPDFSIAQITSKEASIYKIPVKYFIDKLFSDKEFLTAVLENLSYKMRLLSSQVEYAVYKTSSTKIAFFLLATCKHHGLKTESGYKLNIKFTHSEIADTTGLSRVSVTNNFINLIKNDIIVKNKDFYCIKDLKYLYDLLF